MGRLRNKRKKESRALGCQFLWMREVRVLRGDGRQTPILTNLKDLAGVEVAYRAFDRWRQENFVAVLGDRHSLDALHNEVGAARLSGTAVQDVGDVGVVHHRQRLPLGFKASHDLAGIHPRLDDLQSHLTADRLSLLGHVDDAHAALADFLEEFQNS